MERKDQMQKLDTVQNALTIYVRNSKAYGHVYNSSISSILVHPTSLSSRL